MPAIRTDGTVNWTKEALAEITTIPAMLPGTWSWVEQSIASNPPFGAGTVIAPPPNGTDDYAAIAALLGTGVVLQLQKGTYIFSNPLLVPANSIIRGCGEDLTICQIKSGSFGNFATSNRYIFNALTSPTVGVNVVISDMTLDGNKRSGTGAVNQGGLITTGDYWFMDHIKFYDCNYFPVFTSQTGVRIRNCRWVANISGNDCIGGGPTCADFIVENGYWDGTNTGTALDLVGGADIIFRNNYVLNQSIYLEGMTDSLCEGNYLKGGGFVLQSASAYTPTTNINPRNIIIRGNTINGNGVTPAGVSIRYDDYAPAGTHLKGGGNIISDNAIHDQAKVGILVFGSADTWKDQADVICDNKITNVNTDSTNSYNTGLGTLYNVGIAVGIGVGDIIVGNAVTDNRGGGAKMQYGYDLGANAAATTVTGTIFLANTSVGHTLGPFIGLTPSYTGIGLDTIQAGNGIVQVTTSGQNQAVIITDLGGNGAGIKLVGNAGNKFIRTHPSTNALEVLDSAHANVILGLTDVGAMTAAAGTATPAGGSTTAFLKFGSAPALGIYFGSGAPTISAPKGSLYLRTDGASNVTRAYIATDAVGTWTAMNTVA